VTGVLTAPDDFTIACVIPTHARDVTLRRAIESVLRQTQPVPELVVVDDVGSAATERLVRSYTTRTGAPVTYVDASSGPAKSASRSRNLGAAAVTSNYVAFLDDDDEWSSDYVASVEPLLARRPTDFVLTWTSMAHGSAVRPHLHPAEGRPASAGLARNPGITGSNLVVRRDRFRAVHGFDESLWVAEDQDLFVRLRDAGATYAVLDRHLVVQHADGSGHLSSPSPRHAAGVRTYKAKVAHRLTRGDTRALDAWFHRASRHPSQGRVRLAYHLARQLVNTPPAAVRALAASRLRGSDRPYR
jgi:cellulose synthase/poly-beta-1,6-N-acetylglucosamine synthase-like glycosyltransferase